MNAVLPNETPLPYLVAISVSRRCNLSCAYCYLDATQRWKPQSDELGQRDLAPVFAELGLHAPGTIVVLTGGEPLLHGEIEPMVEAGVEVDLRVVLGTNGVLLSEVRIKRFKALGLAGVGISGEFLGVLPDPLPGLPRGDSTFFFVWPLEQLAAGTLGAMLGGWLWARRNRRGRGENLS